MMKNTKNVFMGWKCPECGRIFSPYLHTCPHCTGEERYSKPVENKNIPVEEEKKIEKINLTQDVMNEWLFGPAEGGES